MELIANDRRPPEMGAFSKGEEQMKVTPKDLILANLKPHICTRNSCGGFKPKHIGCMELDSDIFLEATKITVKRYDGTPQAPD